MFESLSPHDQSHLIAAYRLAGTLTDDEEIRLAALLHDIGKVTLSARRISLAARVLRVLAQRLPHSFRGCIRPDRDGAWLTGPWLAEHHASLGAERLLAIGVPAEVCQLVARHDEPGVLEPRLVLLQDIDSSTL